MATVAEDQLVAGLNGVVITHRPGTSGPGYRTYEVHQRERVGESTEKIKPIQLVSEQYRRDPYPLLEILRENYPCYRNWLSNSYWVTRYDDVTSIFVDEGNFETRPKTWYYGLENFGRDLREELPVLVAQERGIDENAGPLAESVVGEFAARGECDLSREFAARYPLEMLGRLLDLPDGDLGEFAERYWRMQRGVSWEPNAQQSGLVALNVGSAAGVKRGMTFEIFNGRTYKGQVRVENVHENMCSALIVGTPTAAIGQGDSAATNL